jgi:hypothetical protein
VLTFGTLKLREARDLLRKGRAAGTVNRYLSAMRSVMELGARSGLGAAGEGLADAIAAH